MYNLSTSGTNPTTKTEVHNSVPFITKVRADAYYPITSTINWKWAIIRFSLFVIVLLFVYSDHYEKVPRTPKFSSYPAFSK